MRDDFNSATKELMAKRVGFKCSNPGCPQTTAGPHEDPSKSVNIGVAAHITAASPDGPRYDPRLTPEQRRSAENGIWLCQNHAKLVDNDEVKYTVQILIQWKMQAEVAASRELEQHRLRYPDYGALFERMERLMPALLAEMRLDLAGYPLRREFVVKERNWGYWAKGNELYYYYEDHAELDDKLRILENEGLIRDITYNNAKRYIMSEQLAAYLGAP